MLNQLHQAYYSLSRTQKRCLLIIVDAFLCFLAIFGAFWLRNSVLPTSEIYNYSGRIFVLILLKLTIFYFKGMYRPILRYTDLEFLTLATQSVLYSSGALVFLVYLQGIWPLPRAVVIIDALLTLVLVISVRVLIRELFQQLDTHHNRQIEKKRVVIYGAGIAGSQLARALSHESAYQVIAFVDDNPELHHRVNQGIKVHSSRDLSLLWQQKPFEMLILAMPTLSKARKREILYRLETIPVIVKTIPPLSKFLSGEVAISKLDSIDVTELLGREEIIPYRELLEKCVTGKSVLVTGAGGSIGAELCRQIAKLQPKCLILYEINEFALYNIDLELAETYRGLNRSAYLGNVTDRYHFQSIVEKHQVDTIYHTAAYKHVPLVEANAAQGVYNNVSGTLNTACAALAAAVRHYVLISTDKAVRPTNVMGASKRVAELIIQALAEQSHLPTCFAIVRFGNVLDSSGSVVPRFRQQIAQGKPITVTHPEVTRYFMSIPEAVRLVIQAGAMASGGEIFLLDMGEPIRIYNLALQMIRLSGLEPGKDIEIIFTGLRPGEKLYEELLIERNKVHLTLHPHIFAANERKLEWGILLPQLETLLLEASLNNYVGLIESLKILVPEFQQSVVNNQWSRQLTINS